MISPVARIRAWLYEREEDRLEQYEALWYAGFQAGYDEGFLEAISEPEESADS